MGLGEAFKKLFKFIIAGAMTVICIIGVILLLYSLGKLNNDIPAHAGALKFFSIVVIVFGVIFGVIPFLGKLSKIIKFAFSLLGIVICILGICGLIQHYNPGMESLAWASMDEWVAWIATIIGILFGVLPFFKFTGRLFSKEK